MKMQPEKNYRKNEHRNRDSRESKCSQKNSTHNKSDFCTKILAWILLTVGFGLFIIAMVIFITAKVRGSTIVLDKDTYYEIGQKLETINENSKFSLRQLSDSDTVTPESKRGCYEKSCRIECYNNTNIYTEAATVMTDSNCEVITSLVLSNQLQNNLENSWIDVNSTVLKIVLIKSEITKIKSGAFSSLIFAKAVHMTWVDLKLDEINNGALLGLYSLKKLEIDFRVPNLGMTFLQPVQLTLTHLRINGGISFRGNLEIFDKIHLAKLYHLDLSYNPFSGPLSKRFFTGTPNVAYLYLKYCAITAIEDNAFEDIANKLILVDLKHNLLTQINADLLGIGGSILLLDVEPNNWICNCQLQSLINLYNTNKSIFISAPYCRNPLNLYGRTFDELNPAELSCETPHNVSTTTKATTEHNDGGSFYNDDHEVDPTNHGIIIQLSCTQAIDIDAASQSRRKRDVNRENKASSGYFIFEPPSYDLELELLQNYSVRAAIEGYPASDNLNIIWFTEEMNSNVNFMTPSQNDYNCMQYEGPYLILDPLEPNHTYTFCMMSMAAVDISPLFCQPLHVPTYRGGNETDQIVSSDDSEKQFTIGMLCLIFFISTICGAIFAYLGLKSFPQLLEGSKNVLVIKESDKTCRVSTIAESQFMKSSFNKGFIPDSSFASGKHKLSDVSTGFSGIQLSSPLSFGSSSTCFEESFTNLDLPNIEYEMPMQFNESCTLSTCLERPNSPPPLPKRNSTVSLHLDQQLNTAKDP